MYQVTSNGGNFQFSAQNHYSSPKPHVGIVIYCCCTLKQLPTCQKHKFNTDTILERRNWVSSVEGRELYLHNSTQLRTQKTLHTVTLAAQHTIPIYPTTALLQVFPVSFYTCVCYVRARTYHGSERNSARGVIINSYKIDKAVPQTRAGSMNAESNIWRIQILPPIRA
jgi:hypothetical protein